MKRLEKLKYLIFTSSLSLILILNGILVEAQTHEEDVCPEYNHDALTCRKEKCYYSCGDKRCTGYDECGWNLDDKCQDKCFDLCLCQKSGNCEYDLKTGSCRPGAKDRYCYDSKFGDDECTRDDGGYYSVGGHLCQNFKKRGNCFVDETIKAVNFGGNFLIDSRGIPYQTDSSDLYADYHNISRRRTANVEIVNIPAADQLLYGTFVYGDSHLLDDAEGHCISYWVHLCEDGKYELAIRLASDRITRLGSRKFTILFGEVVVFPEMDLYYLAGGPQKATNLYVNFEVIEGGTKVLIKGHRQIPIPKFDKNVWLALCYSSCDDTDNKSFLVAGFSVVRFGKPKETEDVSCSVHMGNVCDCRHTGHCEYNVVTQQCLGKARVCSYQCRRDGTECRRAGDHIFYADGGVVCNNREARGDCTVAQKIMAINFNGDVHTDINGIRFDKDEGFEFDDPYKTKSVHPSYPMTGVPKQDIHLYDKYIWGKINKRDNLPMDGSVCLTYYVPMNTGDGNYELSIKTGEIYYSRTAVRGFQFVFNGQFIVKEYEPGLYRGGLVGFDLNVNFKVFGGGTKLKMKGHPPSDIRSDKKVPFAFCSGTCDWSLRDPNWIIGGFSVVKFRK